MIWAEKAYFCIVVNKNYMATKKKQITETTKPVELPKEKPVAPEVVRALVDAAARTACSAQALKPTYAATQYLSDSFECTRCYQLATRRFGKTPVWQDPAELWEAYAIYTAWCEATPVIVYEAIKSGPMAGTLYEVPKKHLQSESEFTAFLGASTTYISERRITYTKNFEEFGLSICKDFVDVIDRIRAEIAADMDQGASVGQFDAQYIRALRGIKMQMDYTSNGEAIKGGLTVNVTDPKVSARMGKLKDFKKDHKGEEEKK